jgi:sec-independent protein translocase protein TatA
MQHTFLFISGAEIIIVLLVVVMLFGSKKIPALERGLGKGLSEFKRAANDIKKEISTDNDEIVNEIKDIKKTVDKYRVFEKD